MKCAIGCEDLMRNADELLPWNLISANICKSRNRTDDWNDLDIRSELRKIMKIMRYKLAAKYFLCI